MEQGRRRKFREDTFTQIDKSTGEVIQQEVTQSYTVNAEPNYIKLYYETMLTYNGIKGIPVNFVLGISKFLTYTNEGEPMTIALNQMVKEYIMRSCGVEMAQVYRYIKKAKEEGLLFSTRFRGVYEVNPFFIAKGNWDSIRKLQAQFDFIEGSWTRKITVSKGETPQNDEQPLTTKNTTPAQFVAQKATQETISEPLPGQEAFFW